MNRFIIVWLVFSLRKIINHTLVSVVKLREIFVSFLRLLLRYGRASWLLAISYVLCRFGILGRNYRNRSKVATQNYQCLIKKKKTIDTAWIAIRRYLLEEGATWGRNKQIIAQLKACSDKLDSVVMPLHQQKIPVILAPLHMVSDVLATMVAAGTTPRDAAVIVSSSAEKQKFNLSARELGGIKLSYCSIHQEDTSLANDLINLMTDVAASKKNMIIFPDITPDFTIHTGEGLHNKLACRLFDRPAKLHSGIIRLSSVISAYVIFYNLYCDNGLQIKIHEPVLAKDVATQMPIIIENAIRDYPDDWLLWHSHSLYFINH